MEYVLTSKVVTDQVLFTPTGAFGRWAKSIEYGLYAHGVSEAPLNRRPNKSWGALPPGSLKASIRVEFQQATLRRYNIELSANTPYASYVHEGTNDIYARNKTGRFSAAAFGMHLPANPGYGKARWRQKVRGQKANPFLKRAWNEVSRQHSSMGRFSVLS